MNPLEMLAAAGGQQRPSARDARGGFFNPDASLDPSQMQVLPGIEPQLTFDPEYVGRFPSPQEDIYRKQSERMAEQQAANPLMELLSMMGVSGGQPEPEPEPQQGGGFMEAILRRLTSMHGG